MKHRTRLSSMVTLPCLISSTADIHSQEPEPELLRRGPIALIKGVFPC
ncbi:hypothetical protein [Halopseudomonas salina]|nr:hypothetical protein [Halopseudomonas salina]